MYKDPYGDLERLAALMLYLILSQVSISLPPP